MADPNVGLTWSNLEARLVEMLRWPHNRAILGGQTPEQKAKQMIQEIAGAFIGIPQPVEFVGPKRFLRASGPRNTAFSGSWWFEEKVLLRLEKELSRIPLPEEQRQQAMQGRLRSGLAVSVDWNPLSEIWILELPAGERLPGLMGRTRAQPVYSAKHPEHDPKRILAGEEIQIYFPVKNPLWVRRYR